MNDITEQLKNYTVLCVEDEDGIRKRLVNTFKILFCWCLWSIKWWRWLWIILWI